MGNVSDKDRIKEDIRQGKEYEIIALKFETSYNYVKKIAREMKQEGERLIDRKSKKWKIMQIRRKDDEGLD